jgi:predicted nucleotidyltransferase
MNKKIGRVKPRELEEAYMKVLHWFFSFPNAEIGLNELSSNLRMSKTTVKKAVKALAEEEFLVNKPYGNAWRITCNAHHHYNFSRKIAYNIEGVYQVFEEGLREHILKVVRNPKCIVLFGSYRKGDDNEKSDIDIAAEVPGNEKHRITALGKVDTGFRHNVVVNLHIFSRKNVDINLFSNIANGFVLEGFLEVSP